MAKNIQTKIDGSILTIVVDLSKTFGRSKSGKSETVATTEGNIPLGDAKGTKLGLNVYR